MPKCFQPVLLWFVTLRDFVHFIRWTFCNPFKSFAIAAPTEVFQTSHEWESALQHNWLESDSKFLKMLTHLLIKQLYFLHHEHGLLVKERNNSKISSSFSTSDVVPGVSAWLIVKEKLWEVLCSAHLTRYSCPFRQKVWRIKGRVQK